MNTRLYRKYWLYRLFFIEEVQGRQRKALYRRFAILRGKALQKLKDDFDKEIKAGNYGEALEYAQCYFQLEQIKSYYEN